MRPNPWFLRAAVAFAGAYSLLKLGSAELPAPLSALLEQARQAREIVFGQSPQAYDFGQSQTGAFRPMPFWALVLSPLTYFKISHAWVLILALHWFLVGVALERLSHFFRLSLWKQVTLLACSIGPAWILAERAPLAAGTFLLVTLALPRTGNSPGRALPLGLAVTLQPQVAILALIPLLHRRFLFLLFFLLTLIGATTFSFLVGADVTESWWIRTWNSLFPMPDLPWNRVWIPLGAGLVVLAFVWAKWNRMGKIALPGWAMLIAFLPLLAGNSGDPLWLLWAIPLALFLGSSGQWRVKLSRPHSKPAPHQKTRQ